MRDIILFTGMLFYLPMSLIAPAAGMLAWEWFSIMNPHRMVYGFSYGLHLNFVIALATIAGWLFSRERKRFPPDALPWVMVAFVAWFTFNMLFVPLPETAWYYWDEFIRIFIGIFLVFLLQTSKARIHGMIWAIVISVGFYGAKGGLFTIVTMGGAHVWGPAGTMVGENNALALIEVLTLPLIYYLAKHTGHIVVRAGLFSVLVLQIISILGSYSRGGFIALGVVLLTLWLRLRNKMFYAAIGLVVLAVSFSLMPPAFWDRMATISHMSQDGSFEGRVTAWKVAYHYANDHFPFGAGFYSLQTPGLFHQYFPDSIPHAAHSIYFQVLGEQGYPGLTLYLIMLVLGLRNARIIIRQTKARPELAWAGDLARMIWAGLLGFYVGGSALSLAYFDGFLVLLALTSTLRELTAPARVSVEADNVGRRRLVGSPAMPFPARGRYLPR